MSGDLHPLGAPGPADVREGQLADILVVDDDETNLLAIEVALGELGRRLVKTSSGAEALRRLLEQDFSLILLDIQMPGMDGFEVARLIRARARSRHVPIIFVTAYNRDDADVLRGYQLGAVDFLFKPIVPEVLRAKASVFVELQDRTALVRAQEEKLRELERREHKRKLAEERQRWEAEVLREENRRKDEFLAMLAHELRNPLAPMVTGLELIKMSACGDPMVDKALESMERQVTHLTRLVDDLLDVSRISQGKITLRQEPLDLQRVIAQAVDSVDQAICERKHELVIRKPDGPIELVGDPVRLGQVVANLLSNAARYTDPGGHIAIEYGRSDGEAFIRVRDDGRGIAPEMLPRIFDLFVQEREGGKGLGLGLTLVHRLVELHGGRVHAASEGRGKGSVFEVRIPRPPGHVTHAQPEASSAAAAAPAAEAATPTNGEPLHVAIVEDDPDIRDTVSALLTGWGHVVEAADDGPSGVDLVLRTRPDVALLDIGMPGLDGYQVAERIRTALGDDAPRLVAVTGFGSTKDKARAREAGFDAHIVKPARPLDLRRALMKRATPQAPSTTNRERHAHDRPAEAGDAHQEAQGRRKRNGKDTRRQRPKRGGGKPHA